MLDIVKNFDRGKDVKLETVAWVNENKGLSGGATLEIIAKSCQTLNIKNECYLEVGIYQGVNLVGVAKKVECDCWGVDDFSHKYNEDNNYSMSTEEVVFDKIKSNNLKNCIVKSQPFEEFFKGRKDLDGKKVKVYYYDGHHTTESQINGITMAFSVLAKGAIIFIDDYASEAVKASLKHFEQNNKNELRLIKVFEGGGKEGFGYGIAALEYIG